jgi:hypothetical protein
VADDELYISEEGLKKLDELGHYTDFDPMGHYDQLKRELAGGSKAPSFGNTATWPAAGYLNDRYGKEFADTIGSLDKLLSKVEGLAEVAGKVAQAYRDLEQDVKKNGDILDKAFDVDLPALTKDIPKQPQ